MINVKQNTHNISLKLQQTQEALRTSEQNNNNLEATIQQQRLAQNFNDAKDKKDATTMPSSKEMMKTQKVNKGPSALDIVKADIRKKMGKGAIMDMGKK